jgi:transposase
LNEVHPKSWTKNFLGVFFMGDKKVRHYTLEEKMCAIRMYESGSSSIAVSRELGYSESKIRYWINQYRENGVEGLQRRPSFLHYSADFKKAVVDDILENLLSFDRAAIKYGISPASASHWIHIVAAGGYNGLNQLKKQGRQRKNMGRPKKEVPQSDIKKLQDEIVHLKAENAYLKKLRALVEQRIARESGKSSKPSKN